MKGTPSFGNKKRIHIRCRRCGRGSYHKKKGSCAACGFGKTKKIKNEAWKNRDFLGNKKV